MDAGRISLTRRAVVIADGWSDHDLRRQERRGELTRVRRGSYADPKALAGLNAHQRHRVAVEAATRKPTPCIISHASAAVIWGLPLHGVDLSRVHFTRPGAVGGRRSHGRVDHGGILLPGDVVERDGIDVTTPARTLVDLARTESPEAAVVAADHAFHHGTTTPEAVREVLDRSAGIPGIGSGRRALLKADGRSESPGESLTRFLLDGLTSMDAQVELRNPAGHFVARVDFADRAALLIIEFDGRQKYLALRPSGQSLEDAVLVEKRREDAIRGLGYLVARVVWADLADPTALRRRIADVINRGRDMHARGMVAMGSYRPATPIRLAPAVT
jgi:very-short-patch-repair endonuclease